MSSYRHLKTVVLRSEMDFRRIKPDTLYKGSAELDSSVATPKDPENNRNIRCSLSFRLGGDDDTIKLMVETLSYFEITELSDCEKLRDEAVQECTRMAVNELKDKLDVLTGAHLGTPLNLPLHI